MERAIHTLLAWLTQIKTAVMTPITKRFAAAQGMTVSERARLALAQLRRHPAGVAIARELQRLQEFLAAQSSARLKGALTGLLLLEAFFVCILLFHLVDDLDASPLDASQPPNDTGLAFTVIVIMPTLILALRSQYMKTREAEQRRAIEARRMARQVGAELARAYGILYLQPGAPLHIAQAAYTAAMKHAHPDTPGGDTAAAAELNWAIATIREHAVPRQHV